MGGIYGFLSQMMEPETTSMLHGAGNARLATRPQREKQARHVRMTCRSHSLTLCGLGCCMGMERNMRKAFPPGRMGID